MDGARVAGKRRRVNGVDRVFQLLDHLSTPGAKGRPADLARAIQAPASTLYEIVDDLVARGVLRRSSDGVVTLGPTLMRYGLAYGRVNDFADIADRAVRQLSAELGESVQLCARDHDMMVVVMMADGPGPFQVTSRVGTRVPLNWTASGRLLTGHLPEAERIALYRAGARPSPTGRAETDPERLASAAKRALEDRLSIQVSESDYAVACIAAPIVRPDGECVATISVVVPESRARSDSARLIRPLQAAAERIERELGWRP